jgi:hypothetical protein
MKPGEGYTSSRAYLSVGHLKNAAHFARLTGEVERHKRFVWGTIKPHDAYAMGAVLSSVAFVEAAVNEVYADAADDSHPMEVMRIIGEGYAERMPEELRSLLAGLWNTQRWRMTASTLDKYQVALGFAGAERFDPGAAPFQDVRLLIQLRNALVHFEPTSHHEGISEPSRLERSLTGKFDPNPLAAFPVGSRPDDPVVPFLPDRCLGHGCALWTLRSSVAFTQEFFTRMDLEAHHGGRLPEMALQYASMSSLEGIAERYGTSPEHLVEHPVEHPPESGGRNFE